MSFSKTSMAVLVCALLAACGQPPSSKPSKVTSLGKVSAQTETAVSPAETKIPQVSADEAAQAAEPAEPAEPTDQSAAADSVVREPTPETPTIRTVQPSVEIILDEESQADNEAPVTVAGAEIGSQPEAQDEGKAAKDEATEDIISTIIWDIQAAQPEKPAPAPTSIPEGPDPSLAEDALAAAFALLTRPLAAPETPTEFVLAEKDEGQIRIALLVPLSGAKQPLGEELRRGAEMALFAIGDDRLQLLSFDTAAGPKAMEAAGAAAQSDADIIIGPLFSDAVGPARDVAQNHGIPMLLLSNNADVIGQNSWIMGYVPEQQLDVVLAHAISQGKQKFAILAQNSPFGDRLKRHAEKRLGEFALTPMESQTLTSATLGDEEQLKQAIKRFARYVPPADDEAQPIDVDPVYDAVIIAGDAAFALRTGPVLAYYDIGSDKVAYLGNALWNQSQILMEPSLQGSIFAARPSGSDANFNDRWQQIWDDRPGLLARLSFDATAIVSVLSRQADINWQKALTANSGFTGFSGAFRLLPDGGNVRAFELRQITNGTSTLLSAAPEKI